MKELWANRAAKLLTARPVLVGLGLLLALPTLWAGLQFDDYMIRAAVLGRPPVEGITVNPWEPFSFLTADQQQRRAVIDRGLAPWWTDSECRVAFMRPLAAATHMLDYRLWDDRPRLMHVHSLLWFALLIYAAATLYRRLMCPALPLWVAGLAALLFACDEAHVNPAGWLANRSALLAGLFGILTLIAHHRWRRDQWLPAALLAPLAFAAALLAKEVAVCTAAYLLAYALFLERGSWRPRFLSLLPCLMVGAVWYAFYKGLGFGAFASGVYIDPGREPVRFACQAVRLAPLLLLGQWGIPGADAAAISSAAVFRILWCWAFVFLALLSVLLAPLLKRDPLARFWAFGMMLSLLPACAAFASDRLLMFVGIGAMGLLAQFLGGLREGAPWLPRSAAWKRLARVFAWLLIAVHLVLAPLLFLVTGGMMVRLRHSVETLADSLPDDPQWKHQTAVFVNSESWFVELGVMETRDYRGDLLPARHLTLNPSGQPVTLRRGDAHTLVVRAPAGYVPPRGTWPEGDSPAPLFSPVYLVQTLDLIVRNPQRPMLPGEPLELTAVSIEVTALTADGRPAEVAFRFAVPLEDPSLRWFRHTEQGYVPFTPPAIGRTVEVATSREEGSRE